MRKGCLWAVAITGGVAAILLIVIIVGVAIDDSSPENEQKRAAEEAEERRKGFHCLNPLYGHHDGLKSLVQNQLRDPSSIEIYETRIAPVNELGRHTIVMDFGARNAFGGMVRNTATGWVDNETCEPTLLAIN